MHRSHSEYYQKNKERYREMARKRYHKRKKECPEAIMLEHARGRANRGGLEFNIELSDISIPSECPILGIPLKIGIGKISYCSPVLDRKDNEKGYIKGNVAVISNKANILKSNCSHEQIRRLYEYVSS